jgi:hypothetical protein
MVCPVNWMCRVGAPGLAADAPLAAPESRSAWSTSLTHGVKARCRWTVSSQEKSRAQSRSPLLERFQNALYSYIVGVYRSAQRQEFDAILSRIAVIVARRGEDS